MQIVKFLQFLFQAIDITQIERRDIVEEYPQFSTYLNAVDCFLLAWQLVLPLQK